MTAKPDKVKFKSNNLRRKRISHHSWGRFGGCAWPWCSSTCGCGTGTDTPWCPAAPPWPAPLPNPAPCGTCLPGEVEGVLSACKWRAGRPTPDCWRPCNETILQISNQICKNFSWSISIVKFLDHCIHFTAQFNKFARAEFCANLKAGLLSPQRLN